MSVQGGYQFCYPGNWHLGTDIHAHASTMDDKFSWRGGYGNLRAFHIGKSHWVDFDHGIFISCLRCFPFFFLQRSCYAEFFPPVIRLPINAVLCAPKPNAHSAGPARLDPFLPYRDSHFTLNVPGVHACLQFSRILWKSRDFFRSWDIISCQHGAWKA